MSDLDRRGQMNLFGVVPEPSRVEGEPPPPSEPPAILEGHRLRFEHADYRVWAEHMSKMDVVIMDPPFDEWSKVDPLHGRTTICFTNFQNRHHVERLYGRPRFEVVWFFKDGRWVSHRLPRITHETILIYGDTRSAYVGPRTHNQEPQRKGKGSVGRSVMPERFYQPRHRKALNSVLEYPRAVSSQMGCWGKPLGLVRDLLCLAGGSTVADPFAGACTVARVALPMGMRVLATESDKTTFDQSRGALMSGGFLDR